jgi:hypothetical protein
MPVRRPVQYDLNPKNIDAGTRWLTLSLRNIGTEALRDLEVGLRSTDAHSIGVFGRRSYISAIKPNEEQLLSLQVWANSTGSLNVSLNGWRNGQRFHWESPAITVTVAEAVAELAGLSVMAEPHPRLGHKMQCEATLRGLARSTRLILEFWAATPGGEFKDLAEIETQDLSAGEEVSHVAEITPEEEGLYTIYAYLYDGTRRIGYKVEHVYPRRV